jgi:tetratricopeptide (TPR) repeat protein
MKKTASFLFIVAVVLCIHCTRGKMIPITCASENARNLYDEALVAYQDVFYQEYLALMVKAVAEEPDFFMANYRLAMYSLYVGDIKRFREYGSRADKCTTVLGKGEIIMKEALSQLLKKEDSDVRTLGKKLVKLYPGDEESYLELYYYQDAVKDYKGQEATLRKALSIAHNPAYIHNMLGYIYMNLNKKEEAAQSFDKYIELEPNLPNPYDSKGDFYMFYKDYRNAYESFMKANSIDSTFSISKAMKAKAIADSLGQ